MNNYSVSLKKKAGIGGAVLILTSIVSKFLGAIYRVPLTNILGAQGIGMYQLIFPIYALMLSLSSGGIPTAISRLVAEKGINKDEDGRYGIIKTATILLVSLGIVFMSIMLLLSTPLAMVQGNDELKIVYYAISPAILIVSLSSVLKGYFQGVIHLVPTAIAQLIEQVSKMIVGLSLSSYLMRYGLLYAVVGATIGVVVAELCSAIALFYMYIKHRDAKIHVHIHNIRAYSDEILRVSIPITLSGIIFPILQVVDSILIVNILRSIGMEIDRATQLYGLLTGPVGTLINMPIVVTLTLCVIVIPVISRGRVVHDAHFVKVKCHIGIKLSYMIGVPCFVGIFFLSDRVMSILYPSLSSDNIKIASGLLRVSAIIIVLLQEVHIYSSIMEALDKTRLSMWALVIGGVVKVILSIVLISKLSIVGACIASICGYLVVTLIDSIYLRMYLGKSDNMVSSIAKILVSSLIMAVPVYLSVRYIDNIYASLVVAIVVGVALYSIFMVSLQVMDDDELMSLPYGRILVYITHKLRFWENSNDKDNRTRNS